MTRTRRALTLTLALLISAAGVSACSQAEEPKAAQATPKYVGVAAGGEHNQADVDFAKKLFPYHIQANVIAGIGQARGESQQVKEFAAALQEAQSEPTAKLGGWLTGWKETVPAGDSGGPLDAGDVDKLTTVSEKNFDVTWLALVIKHQKASIKQLEAYQKKGQNSEVEQYVQQLVEEQKADLESATELLKTLKG